MPAHEADPGEVARLEAPQRVGRMPPEEVIDLLGARPGVRCLDLGAGTGYMARPLASHLAPGGVVGLDRSRSMLDELGRRARGIGVWIARLQADATHLPLRDGAVGRVLAVNLHHELKDPEAVTGEVHRVLSGGGRVVVVDWAPGEGAMGPPQGHRLSAETLVDQLEAAGFQAVEAHDLLPHHAVVTGDVGPTD